MNTPKTLPPGEEKPLDSERLAELVRKAIDRTLEDVRKLKVPQTLRGVYRLKEQGIEYVEIPTPQYKDEIVWKYFNENRRSKESIALTDYLWVNGAFKKTLSGPNPNKDDWALHVYFEIVVDPLRVALTQTAREHLVDQDVVVPWTVDQDKLEKAIEDVVALYGKHSQLITAFCPLAGLDLSSEDYQVIASDIRLRKWTDRDLCLFLSRHGDDYLWDDIKTPYVARNIAEISFPIKYGQNIEYIEIERKARDRLDLLKWSLLITKDQDMPVSEGTCLLTARLDRRGGRFRRDENLSCGNYTLDNAAIQRCSDLVQQFRSAIDALQKPDDLRQAPFHFGRACVAFLPRDVLLESVMGLEALLVPGVGDSKYRFRLHGAAMLSVESACGEEHYRILGKIYDLRSTAAHGVSVEDRIELNEYSFKARQTLAKVINVIVHLFLDKALDSSIGVAEGVQKYVLKKTISK